jgi:hypothetical protein
MPALKAGYFAGFQSSSGNLQFKRARQSAFVPAVF